MYYSSLSLTTSRVYIAKSLTLTPIIDQLNVGLQKVREVLGNEVATDKEIRESLWYYFFDVEKTVNYILSNAFVTYH